MTGLPDPDPIRNRELIAKRLGWPEDGLPACISLENDFPRWTVYWTKGDLPASNRRGYHAMTTVGAWKREVFGETPEELRAELVAADGELSPPWP